jgi:hypothetical protein
MIRTGRVLLLLAVAAALDAGTAAGQQQQDTTKAPARPGAGATRRTGGTAPSTSGPRATARDRVGADDPRCDDLCQRERRLDSLYGKDRERLPASARRTPRRP